MRLDEQIKATGADVQPVDEKGMGLVLKRLESARKLGSGYQQGMASEWMAFLEDECEERSRPIPTLGTLLKAATRLANSTQVTYAAPSDLWAETWAIAHKNIRQALGTRAQVEIPAAVAGEPAKEIHYRRLWNRAATVTGNGDHARAWALAQMSLTDTKPQLGPMPDGLKQRYKNFPKGLKR